MMSFLKFVVAVVGAFGLIIMAKNAIEDRG